MVVNPYLGLFHRTALIDSFPIQYPGSNRGQRMRWRVLIMFFEDTLFQKQRMRYVLAQHHNLGGEEAAPFPRTPYPTPACVPASPPGRQ